MAKLIQLEIKELGEWCVAGKPIQSQLGMVNPIPAFWDTCFADGTFAKLEALGEQVLCPDYVGFMTDFKSGDGKFTYIVGMMMKSGFTLPQEGYDGFMVKAVSASTAAIGYIQGSSTPDVCMNAHELTCSAFEEKGYTFEGGDWCMELYNCPRFTAPDENGQIILDYYVPCHSKETSSKSELIETVMTQAKGIKIKMKFSRIIGKTVLIGITHVNALDEAVLKTQLYGVITEANPDEGIYVSIVGQEECFTLPPDLSALRPAAKGEYKLHATGEVVLDPDYISTWTVHAQE